MIILGLFTINQLSENNIFSNTNLYVCIFQRSKKQVRSKICEVSYSNVTEQTVCYLSDREIC